MLVRVSGRESAKPGGTAGSNYPVPAEMQGQVFYLTGNYNKLYNCLFTKINYTNCIIAATSVK